jgi:hypothetical protein
MAYILTALKRFPAAVPRTLANLQKLQRLHKLVSDRRDRLAPLAYHTWMQTKDRTVWHPKAHAWVDEKLPMSRQDFAEYNWYKRDLQRLVPLTAPFVFGPIGFLGLAAWMSKEEYLPSSFSGSEDINEIKLKYYTNHQDEIRQKVGPLLQYRMKRLYRQHCNTEHIWLYPALVESYKETFYSHQIGAQRDVRKAEHMKYFDRMPATLLLTNKDPIELTPKLQEQLDKNPSPEELKAILIEAYKEQELHGGLSIGHNCEPLALPADEMLFGDKPEEDKLNPVEDLQPLENLQLTGDRVYVPNEVRQGMEFWDRESHKLANEFIGLPWRFTFHSWNMNRLVTWYEQVLQEDALIARDGGIQKLSDLELKVALLDRAVLRVDEDLTRGDMEARYKEVSYLMSKRLAPSVILNWQTGFFRTTYSPEDDLPESSILPKYNRTRLDVDIVNKLAPDERGKPTPRIHPALFPGAHKTMAAELKTM